MALEEIDVAVEAFTEPDDVVIDIDIVVDGVTADLFSLKEVGIEEGKEPRSSEDVRERVPRFSESVKPRDVCKLEMLGLNVV